MYALCSQLVFRIRVKALNSKSNIGALAKEVVSKCKLIHPGKIKDVEQQLYYLQKRSLNSATARPSTAVDKLRESTTERSPTPNQRNSFYAEEEEYEEEILPLLSSIDEYIEGLYEEMPDKIISTRSILHLARVPENMEKLIQNESLISALSRVLREDGKKSMVCLLSLIIGTRYKYHLRLLLFLQFLTLSPNCYGKQTRRHVPQSR
jgi:flagellin-specific chaperone FliS